MNKCDFCSAADAPHLEDSPDFEVTPAGSEIGESISTGGWASCNACHDLVVEHKWHALERRATDQMMQFYPELPRNRVQAAVRYLHDKFRHNQPPGA